MAKKYLDDTGMSYFWSKLKAYFQEKLVSGTNIKTINSTSLLGSGDIELPSPADYVVEQGTSGIWTYRKWSNGIAECWATTTISGTWSSWGDHYFIEDTYTYPFTFVSRPSLQAYSPATSSISNSSSLSVGSYTSLSETNMKSRCIVALYRPTAGTNNANYPVNIYAIGKWK